MYIITALDHDNERIYAHHDTLESAAMDLPIWFLAGCSDIHICAPIPPDRLEAVDAPSDEYDEDTLPFPLTAFHGEGCA